MAVPKIIEYEVRGNVLTPLVYMDLDILNRDYEKIMLNVKQVRRGKKKRGA